jgi:hypothetical protein
MKEFVAKYAARLAGVVAGTVCGALVNWGVEISPEGALALERFLTELTVGSGFLGYSLVHTWIEHRQVKNGAPSED